MSLLWRKIIPYIASKIFHIQLKQSNLPVHQEIGPNNLDKEKEEKRKIDNRNRPTGDPNIEVIRHGL